MYCKKCGSALPSYGYICKNCGAMMDKEQIKEQKENIINNKKEQEVNLLSLQYDQTHEQPKKLKENKVLGGLIILLVLLILVIIAIIKLI